MGRRRNTRRRNRRGGGIRQKRRMKTQRSMERRMPKKDLWKRKK